MRVGLFVPSVAPIATPRFLSTLGESAEELGFSSLWLGEHVVLFDEYRSVYPYSPDGRIGVGGDAGLLDPFGALAFLAAVTSTIRLGTGICLVPQRNPVYTAKEVATLDWLSGGRLDFGVGIGWQAEEFEALAVPFADRAARCREYLEVMRSLWVDPVSEHHGRHYDLPRCRAYPKPVQQPYPPVHFGGESVPALRRVADLGQGWLAFNLLPEAVPGHLDRLDALLARRGRTRADVRVSVCPYLQPVGARDVERYRDAGVDELVVFLSAFDAESLRPWLEGAARDFVEPASRR